MTIESISSSQNGGFASNEPETGLNSRIGLQNSFILKKKLINRDDQKKNKYKRKYLIPARAKVTVRIGKGGSKLAKVAVEW